MSDIHIHISTYPHTHILASRTLASAIALASVEKIGQLQTQFTPQPSEVLVTEVPVETCVWGVEGPRQSSLLHSMTL